MIHADVVIVGAGIAGLSAALELAPLRVHVITKGDVGGGSSRLAQGGLAAAIGPGDTPRAHAADTVHVAAGLGDPALAALVTSEAPRVARRLDRLGTHFDRTPSGAYDLHREAGHGRARVLHAEGDATGRAIMRALAASIPPTTDVFAHTFVRDLLVEDGRVAGVVAEAPDGTARIHRAQAVLIAAGGVGQLYESTTNPVEVTGDGIAMAARAGAELADLEFVQFHPTALAVDSDPRPLVTEAVRGRGAYLIDAHARRFMVGLHPDAELAPRDIVARGVWHAVQDGGAWLDARAAVGDLFPDAFPSVFAACMAHGVDPRREPIPVATAAHYHMGGLLADEDGRTSLPGLWACGEVASTGLHGANRLASNSLLEGAVVGGRAAAVIRRTIQEGVGAARAGDRAAKSGIEEAGGNGQHRTRLGHGDAWAPGDLAVERVGTLAFEHADTDGGRPMPGWSAASHPEMRAALRAAMSRGVDVVRTGQGLEAAFHELARLDASAPTGEIANMLLVGRLVAAAALERRESRGAHFRADFPAESRAYARRQVRRLTAAAPELGEVSWLASPREAHQEATPALSSR